MSKVAESCLNILKLKSGPILEPAEFLETACEALNVFALRAILVLT